MSSLACIPGAGNVDPAILEFLHRSGQVQDERAWAIEPLTGGVASDIWKVTTDETSFVVKKALASLRVAQDWKAPVTRNASEVEWMLEVAKVAPDAVPRILAHDPSLGAFAMSYFDPSENPVWKEELRNGRVDVTFARRLGGVVAAIHAATARSQDIGRRFANDEVFHSIRVEPYLEATAQVHPDLAAPLLALSRDVMNTRTALVHGDVSPKNILIGRDGPIILDAECAWYGDPSFDLAFCLNHLLLKCIWRRQDAAGLLDSFEALAKAYLSGVAWEPAIALEARAARLLPALLLARVDGKSPVEYITARIDKDFVRHFARSLIQSPPTTLADIKRAWAEELCI
ncbi:aminoglycoside phosphotransferase family protein [Sinorhizobium sp. GL28]|uniref:phosphotransferase n=1 Tax=Sinorhizobium sp. GL28 TaxID=1358418 RepID=UPI00071CE31B|nr:aminoglycoside phosphotransferase family protein [Sinorhizobium sp. GL28]